MSVIKTRPDFTDGTGISGSELNDIADTAINANTVATNISTSPDTTNAGLVGTPSVSVNSEGHLVFSNLKGESGSQGVSVSGVSKTSTSGLTDTYTMTLSDNTQITFQITNGAKGADGVPPTIGISEYSAGQTYYHNNTRLDLVTYGGSTYAPINSSVSGILPTNSTYWALIALKGSDVGGNVSTANNNTISKNLIYGFTPTNVPSGAGDSITGLWTLINTPDLSSYLKIIPDSTTANAFLCTNENGALIDFIAIDTIATKTYVDTTVSSETANRTSADTALGTRIDNEAAARGNAITSERSTANGEYVKNMLHLGAYDTYTYDSATGIYTVTRQTGYLIFNDASKFTLWNVANSKIGAEYKDYALSRAYYTGTFSDKQWTMCNSKGLKSITANEFWGNKIGLALRGDSISLSVLIYLGDSYQTIDSIISYLLGTTLQYKLSTSYSYTETYDERHFARTGQSYIEEWKKGEADRSSNLTKVNSSSGVSNVILSSSLQSGQYTLSLSCGTDDAFTILSGSTAIGTHTAGTASFSLTFTISSVSSISISGTAGSYAYSNIMLNSGSVALPYQPYEGKVVHQSALDSALNPSSKIIQASILTIDEARKAKSIEYLDYDGNIYKCMYAYTQTGLVFYYIDQFGQPHIISGTSFVYVYY